MTTPRKIKTATLIAALISSATITNAYAVNPYQAGSQQWHDYNAMGYIMTQEMNERTAAAQQQPVDLWDADVGHFPTNLRNEYKVLVVQWRDRNENADNRSGSVDVGWSQEADIGKMMERYIHAYTHLGKGCWRPDGTQSADYCVPVMVYQNMCGVVATGRLKNGKGDRFYPSHFSDAEVAQLAPPMHGYIPPDQLGGLHRKEVAEQRALEICRLDKAVRAETCEIPSGGNYSACARTTLN